jgi:hypothetical protein
MYYIVYHMSIVDNRSELSCIVGSSVLLLERHYVKAREARKQDKSICEWRFWSYDEVVKRLNFVGEKERG